MIGGTRVRITSKTINELLNEIKKTSNEGLTSETHGDLTSLNIKEKELSDLKTQLNSLIESITHISLLDEKFKTSREEMSCQELYDYTLILNEHNKEYLEMSHALQQLSQSLTINKNNSNNNLAIQAIREILDKTSSSIGDSFPTAQELSQVGNPTLKAFISELNVEKISNRDLKYLKQCQKYATFTQKGLEKDITTIAIPRLIEVISTDLYNMWINKTFYEIPEDYFKYNLDFCKKEIDNLSLKPKGMPNLQEVINKLGSKIKQILCRKLQLPFIKHDSANVSDNSIPKFQEKISRERSNTEEHGR